MNKKTVASSFAIFMLRLLLYWWLTTCIHEWIHLTVLQQLGGAGYILKGASFGYVVITSPASIPFLVAISGGVGVVVIYGVLALLHKLEFSPEGYAAMFPLIASQGIYAVFEGLFVFSMPASQFVELGQIVSIAGLLIGLVPCMIVMKLQIESLE